MTWSSALAFLGGALLAAAGTRLILWRPPPRSRGRDRRALAIEHTSTRRTTAGREPAVRTPATRASTWPASAERVPAIRRGVGRPGRAALARYAVAVTTAGALAVATTTHLDGHWAGVAASSAAVLLLVRRRLTARRAAKARLAAQAAVAPAVVDLLAACLAAGLNGHLALLRVAERCPAPLRSEFGLIASDLRVGQSPAAALRSAAERTGLVELRAAAGALHAAERWGAPPAEALAARAEALRSRLRLEAEAAAERAAVRLTFPLVLCFLPAFVLLTVVPMIAGAFQALGL